MSENNTPEVRSEVQQLSTPVDDDRVKIKEEIALLEAKIASRKASSCTSMSSTLSIRNDGPELSYSGRGARRKGRGNTAIASGLSFNPGRRGGMNPSHQFNSARASGRGRFGRRAGADRGDGVGVRTWTRSANNKRYIRGDYSDDSRGRQQGETNSVAVSSGKKFLKRNDICVDVTVRPYEPETRKPLTVDKPTQGKLTDPSSVDGAAQKKDNAKEEGASSINVERSASNSTTTLTMKRLGKHKIVSVDATGDKVKSERQQEYKEGGAKNKRKGTEGKCRRKHDGAVKRVRLNTESSVVGGGGTVSRSVLDEGMEIASAEEGDNPTKLLTDFAYREVKAPKKIGRKHPQQHRSDDRNMGLVRVKPEGQQSVIGSSNTWKKGASCKSIASTSVSPEPSASQKVCTAFLRGETCVNERCTRRHDIPKEMATPICSFFQRRGGQCARGESCPFLHVKVNAAAAICPMFSMYGYCDNMACVMKHLRGSKKQVEEK